MIYGKTARLMATAMRVHMRAAGIVRPHRQTTTQAGVRMHTDIRDFVQRRIHYFGQFEHALTQLIESNVGAGDVVIDIGANVGYVSLLAASRVGPTGHVVAIEADPNTFDELSRNIALNPNLSVDARHVAVTAEPCRVSLLRPDARNSGANSVAVDKNGEVEGLPLRDVCGPALLAATFVKIDVEGGEGPILAELAELAPQMQSNLTIVAEVHDHTADLLAPFVEQGFTLHLMQNDYAIEEYLRYRRAPDATRYRPRPVSAYVPGQHDYVLVRSSS